MIMLCVHCGVDLARFDWQEIAQHHRKELIELREAVKKFQQMAVMNFQNQKEEIK